MDKGKLILILIVLLAASVLSQGFTKNPLAGRDTEKVKENAKQFIAKNLMQGQKDAFEIKEVVEENDLYKLTVDLQGREITSYMTKDQSVFFPSALEMKAKEDTGGEEQTAQQQQEEIPESDNAVVQLFTMSFCPYGNQAEGLMKPVVELLGDAVEVEPHFIFYDNYQGGGPEYCLDEDSKYCSMHGVGEANQDIRELCVYNNQQDKYWDYVAQVNQDCTSDDVEDCWKEAAQEVGVNSTSVQTCFEDNKLAYAKEEVKLTDEHGVSGSPSLLINGVKYTGSRSSKGYKDAICGAFSEPPEACNQELEVAETKEAASGGSVQGSCE